VCWHARERALSRVGYLTVDERRFPISGLVARFIDRLTDLSPGEWESVHRAISGGGTHVEMLEASRNAAVALAVRDLISREQFEILYAPFLLAIPIESLETPPTLD
jgi:hypothetical protein